MASLNRARTVRLPAPRRLGGWLRGLARPGVVAAAVGVAAIAVWFFGVRDLPGPLDPATAELWVLFLVFAVAELYVTDARDRSELVPLSPHEAGLVLGFFLLAPTDLVLAQLAGATVALGGVNLGRLRIDVLALRIATLALGTCLGLVVFHAILGSADHTGPVGWVGAIAGASVAAGTSLALGFLLPRGDRLTFDWRLDASNVLNRVTYSAVSTVVGSPQFGLPTRAKQD